jgi:hypothetical protein
MGRGDERITAGWFANGRLGFLWTANKAQPGRYPSSAPCALTPTQ